MEHMVWTILYGPYHMVSLVITKCVVLGIIMLNSKFNLKYCHRVGKDLMGPLNKHVFRVRLYALRVMFPISFLCDHEL